MTNLNKWNRWYRGMDEPSPYADTETYRIGADWLAGCKVVEDWGCGKGWFAQFVIGEQIYVGVDGSQTPFASKHVDLVDYVSVTDGLFMRHVLEHDYRWEAILQNAVESFLDRMALVLFTPMSEGDTVELAFADDPGVPDLSLPRARLERIVKTKATISAVKTLQTTAQYGVETVYLLEKR